LDNKQLIYIIQYKTYFVKKWKISISDSSDIFDLFLNRASSRFPLSIRATAASVHFPHRQNANLRRMRDLLLLRLVSMEIEV